MKVYFLHSGTPITVNAFDENIHLKLPSVYDGVERIFYKKEVINAYSQMNSLEAAGVEMAYGVLDHRSSPKHLLQSGRRFRNEVKQSNSKLVHVTWGTFSALLAVLFSPVPVVVSFCGSDILGGYNATGKRALKSNLSILLSQLAAFGAKKIIAKSTRIKNAVWGINKKKVTVIPNGVSHSTFYPTDRITARKRLGWNDADPVILFFHVEGQSVKNRPLAEATVNLVKKNFPSLRFIIVQNVAHTELIHYYNAADVLLLTSFHEGSNNSVKEALACNLPVVSVNCGDVTDRLKGVKPSAVVSAYDAGLLANEITTILSEPRRSNGQDIIEYISEPYIAAQIMNVYKEALGR